MQLIKRAWDWIRSKISRTYDYVRQHWLGSTATAITASYCVVLAISGSWLMVHIVALIWLYGYHQYRKYRAFLDPPREKELRGYTVR